jgi:hypothetical protein
MLALAMEFSRVTGRFLVDGLPAHGGWSRLPMDPTGSQRDSRPSKLHSVFIAPIRISQPGHISLVRPGGSCPARPPRREGFTIDE